MHNIKTKSLVLELPRWTGARRRQGAYLKQAMQDKLIEHKCYIDKHGEDLAEIRNWKW